MFQTNFNSVTKLWNGQRCATIYNPRASIGQIILDALNRSPEKIIQVSDNNGIELTAEEIRLRTIRAAQRLQRLGYKTGDVIGLMTRNNHNVAPIYFAALCLGCPVNSLDPEYEQAEVVHMFGITQPKVVFCEQECYSIVSKSLEQLNNNARIYTLDGNNDSVNELFAETGSESDYLANDVDAENHIGAIICSTESSGLAKGFCVSHTLLMDIATVDSVNENDVTFTSTSLFWLSGVYMLLSSTIFGAKRIITTKPFSPEYLCELITKYKFTRLHTATQLLPSIAKYEKIREVNLSSIKYYLIGGRNIAPDLIEKVNNVLTNGQVVVGYGITGVGFISLNRTKSTKLNETCGSLKHNLEAKIVNNSGKRVGAGEDGELCVKTPTKLLGYYRNSKATQELFDNEGFVLTGDIAHFDKTGYLHIVDRKRDAQGNPNHSSARERVGFDLDFPDSHFPETNGSWSENDFWKDNINDLISEHFPRRRRKLRSLFADRFPNTDSKFFAEPLQKTESKTIVESIHLGDTLTPEERNRRRIERIVTSFFD